VQNHIYLNQLYLLEAKCYGLHRWFTVFQLYPKTETFLNAQMLILLVKYWMVLDMV